jgi:radical SAM superfamily enzyme YgiQ (UPF0313 family)
MNRHASFEQGPIRPPNEARSLLLRVTRNCPWNRCLFCPVYKGRAFSLRGIAEIKADIQTARDMADDIRDVSEQLGRGGRVDDQVIHHVRAMGDAGECYRGMAVWMYCGTGACFLQDADNLIMRTNDLVEVLSFLREKFPEITRVTTYSRSRTVAQKSVESLLRICQAGLNRVHIGLESGCDAVLKRMEKGVTSAVHIDAGQKLVKAGMEVSEYVMPGLGGQDLWREHALDTARTLNRINPDFIRLRSLRVPPRVPLYEKLAAGEFVMQTDDALVEEIRVFIEALDGIQSTVTSDHMMNLLETVSGKLPEDKDKMLDVIRSYQSLSDQDRVVYRVGRRGGAFRSPEDLAAHPSTTSKIRRLVDEIHSSQGPEGVEHFVTEMVDQYI